MTKEGQQQAWGAEQNQATIGRMPLVRVILYDNNDKIADVGYLKIKIVASKEDPVEPEAESYEYEALTDVYTLACGDNAALNKIYKWHEIEEPIYAHEKISLSKEDFEKYYKLDVNGTVAKQFEKAVLGAKERTTPIGEITLTKTDGEETMTEILTWVVKNQQAYNLLKANPTSPIFTYVRFVKNDNAPVDKPAEFYVKFTWKPSKVNVSPTTKFGDETKIKMYWYANNNATAGTGYANIHGNVTTVGTGDVHNFVVPITNTLVGNKLSVSQLAKPYDGLNTSLKVKAYIMDGNCLYGNKDKKATELHSVARGKQTAATLVATINPETGEVTYADTKAAKDLLNKVAHTDLAGSVTAKIYVDATACNDKYDIPVSNNSFDLKFLRPITITSASVTFTDAETAGSTKDIQMSFIDWRDHNFTSAAHVDVRKGYNYFEFYEVSKIFVDVNSKDATTDINGAKAKLSTVTDKLKFEYTEPTAAEIKDGKYGTLKYENNGVTVGKFKIWFPVTVTYAWGEVKTTLEFNFEKTIANAKRR